jgi:hypothetical protein
MLETSILNAEEHLLNKLFGRVFRADGLAAKVKVQPRIPDHLERLLTLLGIEHGILPFTEAANVIGTMNASVFEHSAVCDVKIADVHHDLSLLRYRLSHTRYDTKEIVKRKIVHRHQEDGVEVSRHRKGIGSIDDFLICQASFLKRGMVFPEDTETAISGTRGGFYANLSEQHPVVVESSSRHGVGHGHQCSRFQRCIWKVEQVYAFLLRRCGAIKSPL